MNYDLPYIPRGRYLILRTDGRESWVSSKPTMAEIAQQIGAETLDVVTVKRTTPIIVMVLDDHGYEYEVVEKGPQHVVHVPTRALKPVNEKATALYHAVCIAGTTHQIVGDVVLCNDSDF